MTRNTSSTLQTITNAVAAATTSSTQINTVGTVPQVGTARTQLLTTLTDLQTRLNEAQNDVATVQNILGVNGPRHYLIGFLNNAETTALGGGPAALSMITVDNGSVSLTASADSGDFPLNDVPARPMDQNLLNIYSRGSRQR
ncbi:DUF4012 domain-containing protein [Subtercola lobariae]|uniref:Uncharacterized protein n=1 Tax=Subtercola lobariae TaxID=1588641 RepID=A0A917B4K6_9MICO|nr:DUF4012 domain-containing protein [Subtercola lobariae]GGF23213.1 hypothetical protein GCM10011399_16010 [Subtercola lobariae]